MEENHIHSDECHDHDHDHNHNHESGIKAQYKWIFTLLFIPLCIFFMKPYIARQVSYRGFTYIGNELYKEAIGQYKKAIFFNNKDLKSMNWMAYCYKMQNDRENAIKTYNKMLTIDPENRNALLNLGLVLGLNGKREEAIAYFEKIRHLGPKNEDSSAINMLEPYQSALNMLSAYYERMGKPRKARDILLELLKNYPNDKQAKSKLKEIETRLNGLGSAN
jgi:tetratricopeptide (TPR) repeat protein